MENEYLVRQTMKVFAEIAINLINPSFKFSNGGAPVRIVKSALNKLEKKHGALTRERIVDYCVCSAYAFKERGTAWTINQAFGPKSIERFDSSRGRRYYEDRWLASKNITRGTLLKLIADKSRHPQSQYVYMPMEESTKMRMLNQETGYIICQSSTLGWSPESLSCQQCKFADKCQVETQKKFPEIFRLRLEYAKK